MRSLILTLCLHLILSVSCSTQGIHSVLLGDLNTSYGAGGRSYDGGFWFTGNRYVTGGNGEYWLGLYRLDRHGHLAKQMLYSGRAGLDVLESWDKTVWIAGEHSYPNSGALLLWIDSSGEELARWQWDKPGLMRDVEPAPDGGVWAFGSVPAVSPTLENFIDLFLVKVGSEAEIMFSTAIDAGRYDQPVGLEGTPSGDLFIASTNDEFDSGTIVAFTKLSSRGDLIWSRSIRLEARLLWTDLELVNDVLVFTGSEASGTRALAVGIDLEGDVSWARSYSAGDNGFFAIKSVLRIGEGFLFAAELLSSSNDVALIKCRQTGEVEWAKAYGARQQLEYVFDVDSIWGSYMISGYQLAGGYAPYFVHVAETGTANCSNLERRVSVQSRTVEIAAGEATAEFRSVQGPSTFSVPMHHDSATLTELCRTTDVAVQSRQQLFDQTTDEGLLVVRRGDRLTLPTVGPCSAGNEIALVDAIGRIVQHRRSEIETDMENCFLHVETGGLANGIYLLVIESDKRVQTRRVLVLP